MRTPQADIEAGGPKEEAEEREKRRRRLLLCLLFALMLLLCCLGALLFQYVRKPKPLPDLLPLPVSVNYPPHYLFSIYGVNQPVGVALSPQGDRIYVAETGGERLVKVFDRNGAPLGSFAPPRTSGPERSPVYVTTDRLGRVYVSDRLQHAIFAYSANGVYLDTILGPGLTLSEYISSHTGGWLPGAAVTYTYSLYLSNVYYRVDPATEQTLPPPDASEWAPLGLSFDASGNLLVTDVGSDAVRTLPAGMILTDTWQSFDPPEAKFGASGQGAGQFLFPNDAVADAQGRIFVMDGNNGRVSVWDRQGKFLFNFGKGAGGGALSLPRGAAIDEKNRLHVVDAVGQNVKVYDVSGAEIKFLFVFGDVGLGDGQFNYPNDIALDSTGRLYIADRENHRVQVWSY